MGCGGHSHLPVGSRRTWSNFVRRVLCAVRAIRKEDWRNDKEPARRDYTLHLGSDPADALSGRPVAFDKTWENDAEQRIRKHIEADSADILKRSGLWLKPNGPGDHWTVLVSPGVAEVNLTVAAMLKRALMQKVEDLSTWTGKFDQRWLLLLNYYPLADDVGEVESCLTQLVRDHANLRGFNGVFWSVYGNRELVSIPFRNTQVGPRSQAAASAGPRCMRA